MSDIAFEKYDVSDEERRISKKRENITCKGNADYSKLQSLIKEAMIYSKKGVYFSSDLRNDMDELFSSVLIACAAHGITVHTELPESSCIVRCNPRVLVCAILIAVKDAVISGNEEICLELCNHHNKNKFEISVSADRILMDVTDKMSMRAAAIQHYGSSEFCRGCVTMRLPLQQSEQLNYKGYSIGEYFSDRYSPIRVMLPMLFG
jgi:hypothetical protein